MQGSDVLLHRNSTNVTIKYYKSFFYTVYYFSMLLSCLIGGYVAIVLVVAVAKQAPHNWTYRTTDFHHSKLNSHRSNDITFIINHHISYKNLPSIQIRSYARDGYQNPNASIVETSKTTNFHKSTRNRPIRPVQVTNRYQQSYHSIIC